MRKERRVGKRREKKIERKREKVEKVERNNYKGRMKTISEL